MEGMVEECNGSHPAFDDGGHTSGLDREGEEEWAPSHLLSLSYGCLGFLGAGEKWSVS